MSQRPSRPVPSYTQPYGALPPPHFSPELLGLVRTGKVYSLAVILENGIPVPGGVRPYFFSADNRHGDLPQLYPSSAATETIAMAAHTGTHIDALCHIGEWQGEEVRIYGDVNALANQGREGQRVNAAEHLPPIIGRAQLLDVAGYKGVDVLPDSYEITAADLQGTLEKQGTTLNPGDYALIRTGWIQYWQVDNHRYMNRQAGLGVEAAAFLAEKGCRLVGADNATVERWPALEHPVHRYLQTHRGITHVENLYLEDLAQDRVYESLLIILPLPIKGSTGSPVHPIAVC